MRVYDAKVQQICLICKKDFNNNKSGNFTSHIINQHQLSLDEYLIKYFYTAEDLICEYELCNNQVRLRRGIPNRFCSKQCAGKGKPLMCVICNKKFLPSNRKTKTCSKDCAIQLKSLKTTAWHEQMDSVYKEKHFSGIISKTAKTRRLNKTPSWNSGKTGIYSPETIEKIRKAALKQLAEGKYRKTSIEKKMEQLLTRMKLNYQYSFITQNVQFDFYLKDYGILIECDGDYWHANPKFYPNEEEFTLTQKRIRKKDLLKNEIAKNIGFQLLRFWEYDINYHIDHVEQCIINALSATT